LATEKLCKQSYYIHSNPIECELPFSVAFTPKRGTKSTISYIGNHNSDKESCVLLITRRL